MNLRSRVLAILALMFAASTNAEEDAVRSEFRFRDSVVPILTKSGCNSGICHGKAGGQNGFKLSLLGFEPQEDFAAIALEDFGRRLSLGAAARSLLLLKASGAVTHGGDVRLVPGSEDYKIVESWIEAGAPPPTVASRTATPRAT